MDRFRSAPTRLQQGAVAADRVRLHLLATLTRSVDYEATLRAIASAGLPHLADWASLYAPGDGEALPARIVVAHRDARKEEILSRVWPRRANELGALHPHVQSLSSRIRWTVSGDAAAQVQRQSCPAATREELRRLGAPRTIVTVPLVAHGAPQGSIMLAMNGQRGGASDRDQVMELVDEFAIWAAEALQNARLFREAKLAIHQHNERLASTTRHVLDLLMHVQRHADSIRETLANRSGTEALRTTRGRLAQMELLARELSLIIRDLPTPPPPDVDRSGCNLGLPST